MKNTSRISWIDSCKGFAIILVVLGHVSYGYMAAECFPQDARFLEVLYNCIYSFHMPLFFTLSGFVFCKAYCMKQGNAKERFLIKCLNLIWIYTIFSVLQWCFKMLFSGSVNQNVSINDLLLLYVSPMAPYWYLYVLLIYYVVFHWCYRRFELKHLILISLFAGIINNVIKMDCTFPISQILYHMLFFVLGIFLASAWTQSSLPKWQGAVSVALAICAVIYSGINGIDLIYPIKCGIAVVCVVAVIYLFTTVSILENNKFLIFCGRFSLEIYVIHSFITAGNRTILPKLGITNFIISFTINSIMAILIPIVLAIIMKKIGIYKIVYTPVELYIMRDIKKNRK